MGMSSRYRVAILGCTVLCFNGCIPDLVLVRDKSTKAGTLFDTSQTPQAVAVFDDLAFKKPFGEAEPSDSPKPIELPTPLPKEPGDGIPPKCPKYKICIGKIIEEKEYIWPLRPRTKPYFPGDPPWPIFAIRDFKNASYPGTTTFFIGDKPFLAAKRMVFLTDEFQTPFDKAATAVPTPLPVPTSFGTVSTKICVLSVCTSLSADAKYQYLRVTNH